MLPEINLFHLTLPVALLFVGDRMTPTPSQGPPIPQGEKIVERLGVGYTQGMGYIVT